jgi:hypothetical protein
MIGVLQFSASKTWAADAMIFRLTQELTRLF